MPQIQVTSFFYDPYRQGYDTNSWRTLLGTPYLDGNRLEITSGAISHYADILKGDITFNLKAPSDPTDMNCLIGLYQPSSGAFIVFDFSGGLTASVSNGTNTINSSSIAWDSNWTGAKVDFRILWEAGIIKFFIAGVKVATITDDPTLNLSGIYIPAGPLALYAFDNSVNPMSIGAIDVRGAQSVFMNIRTSDTAAPAEPVGSMLATQNVVVTDVPDILIPILVPNISDTITLSESLGISANLLPSVNDAITVAEAGETAFIPTMVPSVSDTATIAEDIAGTVA